ncbi:MAG: peptidase T [Clostridia bacterium]|nr:peptidase T [Clostridia bacterium]
MRAYERFLKYVTVPTQSDDESGMSPSTPEQFGLAEVLKDELIALGCTDVIVTDKCYTYAKIPATKGYEGAPRIGFIAHIDTSPDYRGDGVIPILWDNYNGGEMHLNNCGIVISPEVFPHLEDLVGRTVITADGYTLLGADDKAGVAEIMTLAERLITENIPHGEICIAFTPDEEIGEGATHFNIERFGADFAYTVDGGEEGSLEYENFNAYFARVEIKGVSVHPGEAKGKMVNAALVGCEFNSALPTFEIPRQTDGYQGFFHLTDFVADVNAAKLYYIVRDHSAESMKARLDTLFDIEEALNEKYGEETVTVSVREQYRNMKEKIEPCMHLIDNARLATERAGAVPKTLPIRGGTDGARLSFMGLPCPNLGTGGYAFHGPYEHITVEGMDTVVNILTEIVKIYAKEA